MFTSVKSGEDGNINPLYRANSKHSFGVVYAVISKTDYVVYVRIPNKITTSGCLQRSYPHNRVKLQYKPPECHCNVAKKTASIITIFLLLQAMLPAKHIAVYYVSQYNKGF